MSLLPFQSVQAVLTQPPSNSQNLFQLKKIEHVLHLAGQGGQVHCFKEQGKPAYAPPKPAYAGPGLR